MAVRGERFTIDLSDDDDDDDCQHPVPDLHNFVADIRERDSSTPPTPPQLASSTGTGFPSHRKRTRPSAFKRQRASENTTPPSTRQTVPQDEKKSIDEENRRRLASMSTAEIEREHAELMSALSPSLIERLLKRANIEDGGNEANANSKSTGEQYRQDRHPDDNPSNSVSFDIPPESDQQSSSASAPQAPTSVDDIPPGHPPKDLFPASQPPLGPIHFPRPPQPRGSPMPDLDPSSPSFLADLQTHYFPDTPHDPSSLSWLKPSSPDDAPTSAYHPDSTATSLAPASLRFSLSGALLAPKTSLSLPTTLGLHHHAKDSEAAGYTVPELAILSRSSVPAQRCLAWQVLGRLLYRLGKGEFGEKGSSLVEGLWSVIEREKVVAGMLNEAAGGVDADRTASAGVGGIGRHASARAWATEGVWLWRQGGGGDRGLLRDGEIRSNYD
uniref:Transcription factor Rba50 n=1 Tax=Coccidioides posadasii RMSCC 3488 TaxID=454284 RepID=A0A0J6EZJ0_COCPO|nr:hypothetical protein CPAG_02367 [Coccidioides posadasii RMSCC 3488]